MELPADFLSLGRGSVKLVSVDPRFSSRMLPHSMDETRFFVLCWKTIFLKNGLESPLIFVLF